MANKATANKATANKATVKKATANKATANKATANKATANKATANKKSTTRDQRSTGAASGKAGASRRRLEADRLVRQHVLWAMGAGLIPIPLVDFAAVTGIQVDMLSRLAKVFRVEHSASTGKSFVVAVTGTTIARIGASLVKFLPGIGSVLGGVSMSIMAGASTYAVAKVAIEHFARNKDLLDIDLDGARDAYDSAYEDGKDFARELDDDSGDAEDVFAQLEKLGKLRDQGVLTENEFEAQKEKLLERL